MTFATPLKNISLVASNATNTTSNGAAHATPFKPTAPGIEGLIVPTLLALSTLAMCVFH